MAEILGRHTIAGAKLESVNGTAVAVGAGNGIEIKDGSGVGRQFTMKVNDDILRPHPTQSYSSIEQSKSGPKTDLNYRGLELLLAILFGGSGVPYAHPDAHPQVKITKFVRTTLASAMSYVNSLGEGDQVADIVRMTELRGCRVKSLSVSQDNLERCELEWLLCAKGTKYDSTTNTPSTAGNITIADVIYPGNIGVFEHLDIALAQQDQSNFSFANNEIDASKLKLELESGISDDAEKNNSTKDGMVPSDIGRTMGKINLTFLRDDTATEVFLSLLRSKNKLKMKARYQSDNGVPGLIASVGSPSEDISGSNNTALEFTFELFTDYPNDVSVTEVLEIALSVALLNTGDLISAAIQAAVRASTATDVRFQRLYDNFICNWDDTVEDQYALWIATEDLVNLTCTVPTVPDDDLADELELDAGSNIVYDTVPYAHILLMPEMVFSPPDEEVALEDNSKELTGALMAGYGANPPDGFTVPDDDLLDADFDTEDIRWIQIGRNTSNPLA